MLVLTIEFDFGEERITVVRRDILQMTALDDQAAAKVCPLSQ